MSGYEDFAKDVIKLVENEEGSVAGSPDSPMMSIIDNLSPAPAVIAIASDSCEDIVSGCVAFGAAYAGADLGRGEVMTDLSVLFSSERRAERAFDDYDEVLDLMEEDPGRLRRRGGRRLRSAERGRCGRGRPGIERDVYHRLRHNRGG